MGPTVKPPTESFVANMPVQEHHRPRRGSLPELKTAEKKEAEKKAPTGPRANPLYKTRLCMNFQSTGSCPYTEKCQFAHGVKELEKWESWRSNHSQDGKEDSPDHQQRTRSQSMEKPSSARSTSSDTDFSISPQSLNWEINTPVRPSLTLEDTPISSFQDIHFSLWSSILDDEHDLRPRDASPTSRSRASTVDSTYDNISQLRDAPTLFTSPPVIRNLPQLSSSY